MNLAATKRHQAENQITRAVQHFMSPTGPVRNFNRHLAALISDIEGARSQGADLSDHDRQELERGETILAEYIGVSRALRGAAPAMTQLQAAE